MAKRQAVTCSQHYNPAFNSSKPKDRAENAEWCYRVEKTVNTLRVYIGQTLTPVEMEVLLGADIEVTVVPVK